MDRDNSREPDRRGGRPGGPRRSDRERQPGRGAAGRPGYNAGRPARGGYRGGSGRFGREDSPPGGEGERGGPRRSGYGSGSERGERGGDGRRGERGGPPRSGYRGRPTEDRFPGSASPEGGGRGAGRGGYRPAGARGGPARPPRRFVEPGISDHEEAFSPEESRSLGRAATTGRNLWNPPPRGARRPGGRPPGAEKRGPRRSTNTVGGEQVEGRQAVRELLAAGKRAVSEVWLIEGTDPAPILGEIDNLARRASVPVRMVSARRLESVQRTETPQGVVAFAEPLAARDLDDLVTAGRGGDPFLVVVDGVTDPHNLGAILRSAECAGATGAVLPRYRAVHVTAAVTKAAAGAVEHLPIALVPGVPSALQSLSELGVETVGLDERGECSIFELDAGRGPIALVLGAEGRGLSPLTRRRCDVVASIPLHGAIPSLNVSTAAAVACFEVARRRAGS